MERWLPAWMSYIILLAVLPVSIYMLILFYLFFKMFILIYISILIKAKHQLTVFGMSLLVRASHFHTPCHRGYSGLIIVV